ncbi:hypothetical protein IU487_22480 [Nocardia puris]|uniref:putative phage holin n=1 Tax=Nocardia puris TaxID=208602 RepID=UPI001895C31E|nr:hypothetical protein [Nocardia puris]MBF6213788.1 hypothetical protein [Nocardia puris]
MALLGVAAVLVLPDHDTVVTAILVAIGVEAATFSVLYAARSNWRATAAGRIIMRLMVCIAAIGAHGAANAVTDAGYPGREYIRPLLLLGVAVTVLHLLLRLTWVQRVTKEEARG